jgi:hypothetical protein
MEFVLCITCVCVKYYSVSERLNLKKYIDSNLCHSACICIHFSLSISRVIKTQYLCCIDRLLPNNGRCLDSHYLVMADA